MAKPCVFLLAVALAAGPALAFSDEYKRSEISSSEIDDSRDTGVLYGRDIEFADFLEKRRLQGPLAAVLSAARPMSIASVPHKASLRSRILNAIFNHGGAALQNAHHLTSMTADITSSYHNANPYNGNMKPATSPKRRDLEELFERDLDNEELFGREYYNLDERDIIDDLD